MDGLQLGLGFKPCIAVVAGSVLDISATSPQAAGSGESRTRSESGPYIAEPWAPAERRPVPRIEQHGGALSSNADSPMRASMRAKGAPRQKWGPPPKLRCSGLRSMA